MSNCSLRWPTGRRLDEELLPAVCLELRNSSFYAYNPFVDNLGRQRENDYLYSAKGVNVRLPSGRRISSDGLERADCGTRWQSESLLGRQLSRCHPHRCFLVRLPFERSQPENAKVTVPAVEPAASSPSDVEKTVKEFVSSEMAHFRRELLSSLEGRVAAIEEYIVSDHRVAKSRIGPSRLLNEDEPCTTLV